MASQPSQLPKAHIYILNFLAEKMEIRKKPYRNCESIKSPIQQAKAAIHIRKIAFAKIARDSKISSQPSQPPKAHIHILSRK